MKDISFILLMGRQFSPHRNFAYMWKLKYCVTDAGFRMDARAILTLVLTLTSVKKVLKSSCRCGRRTVLIFASLSVFAGGQSDGTRTIIQLKIFQIFTIMATKNANNVNKGAAKQQGANNAKGAKSSKKTVKQTSKKSEPISVSPKGNDLTAEQILAKANMAAENNSKQLKASVEAFKKASDSLKAIQHKDATLALDVVKAKRNLGLPLTEEEMVMYQNHRLSVYAAQSGIDKAYSLVAEKMAALKEELASAKAEAKSLNAAIRNLLADWNKFAPIFKSVGLNKSNISASLLKEATPFMLLPTGEGLKVGALTRRVKRDSKGNPLKVDGKKQYDVCLKAITSWDAVTFCTTVLTVEVLKGVFSADAEKNYRLFLEEADQSLKALADAKAAAKAAKQAEREAKAAAKAAEVAEDKASKDAIAAKAEKASKDAAKVARKASKDAKLKIAKIDVKTSNAAKAVKSATKGSKSARKSADKSAA